LKILFIDNSTQLQTLDDLTRTGRGGMVTSLRILPDVLSQLNNHVAVLSDIKEHCTTPGGVEWYTAWEWDVVSKMQWDVLVFNRTTANGFPEFRTKHRVLWTHDCVHGGWIPEPKLIKAFSMTVFMSRYSEKCWRYFYPEIGRSVFIPNGVDKKIFYPREKDMNLLIFCSAPNRGASRLSLFFEALRNKVNPTLRLKAFTDMKTMHPAEYRNEGAEEIYDSQYKDMEVVGIERPGCVPQPELAEHLGRASLMLLPSGYPEQCGNSVLQSLASGTPIISTDCGATPEWVKSGWNGMVTMFHLEDYMAYHKEFYNLSAKVLSDPKLHRKLIANAPKTKNLFTWEEIGSQWAKMLRSL